MWLVKVISTKICKYTIQKYEHFQIKIHKGSQENCYQAKYTFFSTLKFKRLIYKSQKC